MFAFLLRDFRNSVSYRLRFFMQFIGALITISFIFFLGKTFQGAFSTQLARYGNDYFAFAILGMAVSSFVSTGLNSLSGQIRNAQVQGTLEALLMTPTSVYTILIGNSLWSFLQSFFESIFYVGVSIIILKIPVNLPQILSVLLVLVLTFWAFLSVGMLSAAITLVFKQGNPINALFGTSSYFLGGLLFPIEVLPSWLKGFSTVLPITHAVRLVREILLISPGEQELTSSLLYLSVFIIIACPVGLLSFHFALKRAKKDGSLVQY